MAAHRQLTFPYVRFSLLEHMFFVNPKLLKKWKLHFGICNKKNTKVAHNPQYRFN